MFRTTVAIPDPGEVTGFLSPADDTGLVWLTGCIGTSMRDYVDNRVVAPRLGGPKVAVPTTVPLVGDPAGLPPRCWVEQLYEVVRWTPMATGVHFAPAEAPRAFAAELHAFFEDLP